MTSPFAVLSIQAFAAIRESSTEWVGNDSFSVAKLILCAVLTTQLPALTKSSLLCGGMALFHLLTGAEMSDGKEMSSMVCFTLRTHPEQRKGKQGLTTLQSTSNNDLEIEHACGDKRGLMAMMRDFSPVVAVQ